ncbi:MFS transporter [Agarivorans sp. Z349TD_8]|uniref:MFS transporter n=1 Tax=Agarivorans sp. Z349TD_8 TaxID=3421434 RepID=UPI003D7D8C59
MKYSQNSKDFWRVTAAVSAASLVTFFNLYLVQPLLPIFARDYQISPLTANSVLSAAMLGMALGLLLLASLSDAIGRRKILLSSIILVPCISLLIGLVPAPSFHYIVVLRFFQGLFLAGVPAVAIAYLAEQLDANALIKSVGIFIAANSLGGIGGRLLGGWGAELLGSWSMAFVLVALLSLSMGIVVCFLLPMEAPTAASPWRLRQSLVNYKQHLGNSQLVAAYLVGGVGFGVFINQFSYLTFILADAPYSLPSSLSSLLFLSYLGGTFTASSAGRIADKIGGKRCIMAGLSLMALASLLSLFGQLWLLLLAMVVSSMGFFFCHAQASAWVNQHATQAKASASALYTISYYLGAACGGVLLQPFFSVWGWSGIVFASVSALTGVLWVAGRFLKGGELSAQQLLLDPSGTRR